MDDRQRKIEAGAGLQESRINQDFIDLLKKYSTPTLIILLIIMGSYVGVQRYRQWQEDRTDQAFADLDNAADVPAVLLNVAADWDGRGSVWEIATLRAARVYLNSARTRTELSTNPADAAPAARLSDERVIAGYREAIRLYESVLARTKGAKPVFAQEARWGIATANMSLSSLTTGSERDQAIANARQHLNDFVEAAQGNDANKVAVGTARLELLDMIASNPVSLFESAQLPESARFVADPMFDPRNLTRDTASPFQGATDVTPMTEEQIQEMIRNLMANDPALSLDPMDTPPADPQDPSGDDPVSDDPDNPGQ